MADLTHITFNTVGEARPVIMKTTSKPASSVFPRAVLYSCCLVGIAVSPASAISIPAAKDTTIFQSGVNNSAGGQTQFVSGTNTAISPRRALIEFDVAGNVPSGATITSVNLTLTLSSVAGSGMGGGGGSPTIELHEVAQEWGEGSVSTGAGSGAAAAAGDATWNSRIHGSALWTAPGGDFDATASASLTIVGTTLDVAYTWSSTPALVADVQGWLNNSANNHGWLLLNTSESAAQTFRAFYSDEASTSAFRPALVVLYTIPEPSTLALLMAGSALAWTFGLRRRRHRTARITLT